MIVPKEEIVSYLGNDLDDLEGKVRKKTLEKLKNHPENLNAPPGFSVIDYLFLEHQTGKSIRTLSKEVGIDRHRLNSIFEKYSLPTLTQSESNQRIWEDPDYARKMKEATKRNWKDPEFKEKMKEATRKNWKDPHYRKKMEETSKKVWGNPKHKEKMKGVMKRLWEDPDHRKKMKEVQDRNWKNPDYRKMMDKLRMRRWEDPKFRKRMNEARRKNASNLLEKGKPNTGGVVGQRADLPYMTQSTWESNLARIFLYCGREFIQREKLKLKVTDKYKQLFNSDLTEFNVDFVVQDNRGNFTLYEIAPRGIKRAQGYAKLEMLKEQHPDLKVRTIDLKKYGRLQKWFKHKIDSHPYLIGWETTRGRKGDNLKTNPKKWAATSQDKQSE